jgi:membrane AbrB-like protein
VRAVGIWVGIAGGVLAGGLALEAAGLPSAYLFAALLIGLGLALARPESVAVEPLVFRGAQAVAGVSLGAYLEPDALGALGDAWLPVALVSLATLGLSLAGGAILARTTPLDRPTAALGMIAGGASGIVGMAGELGADDRLVAFMQYLRVLVVVLITPVGIALLFGNQYEAGGAPTDDVLGEPWAWLATGALAAAGGVAGIKARFPAGVLLVPMLLTGGLVLSGVLEDFVVPGLVSQTAFALIGLHVGLRFTPDTLRLLGRLTGPVLAVIAFLLVTCFGLAVALAATTSATLLDAYLATTPGGLYAVLAVAFGAGASTTFIVAVQSLRVIAMVVLAPLAVRLMLRGDRSLQAERPELRVRRRAD